MSSPDRDRRILFACLRLVESSHDGGALQALRRAQRLMADRQTAVADLVGLGLELEAAADRLWHVMHIADRMRTCQVEGVSLRLGLCGVLDPALRPAVRRMVLGGT